MELSLKDLKELFSTNHESEESHPYKIGEKYLIRTVTMIYTGRLEAVHKQELVLSDAAWIAETERWNETLNNGSFKEVEPYPEGNVIIGRGAILDVAVWKHDLPRVAK